jgi:hypothetical protein
MTVAEGSDAEATRDGRSTAPGDNAVDATDTGEDDLARAAFSALDPDELDEWIEEAATRLRTILEPYSEDLLCSAWQSLGPSGIAKMFAPMRRFGLEDFLRTYQTPMPRRPAKPDAIVIFRKGKSQGSRRVSMFLDFLGISPTFDAIEIFMDPDEHDLDAYRAKYDDVVISAALIGHLFGRAKDEARALLTLDMLGLMPAALAADPEILRLAKDIDAAVTETAIRAVEEIESLAEDELAEEMAEELEAEALAAGTRAVSLSVLLAEHHADEIEELSDLIYDYLSRGPAGGKSAERMAASFSAGEFPDLETLSAVAQAASSTVSVVGRFSDLLESHGITEMPSPLVIERALGEASLMTTAPISRMAQLEGPTTLETLCAEVRTSAGDPASPLAGIVAALEELIDIAADTEADHLALDQAGTRARELDTDGHFSALLTAALRGMLRLAPADSPAPEATAVPTSPTTAGGAAIDRAADEREDQSTNEAHAHELAPVHEAAPEASAAAPTERHVPPSPARPTPKPGAVAAPSGPLPTEMVLLPLSQTGVPDAEPSEAGLALLGSLQRWEDLVAQAVDEGLGIAAWGATAIGAPSALLHLAVLARGIRATRGPLVDALKDAHLELVTDGISGGRGEQIVAWAASLQATVVAPESGIAELAETLSAMLDVAGSDDLSAAVLRCARRRVSLVGAALSTVGNLASLGDEISERAKAAASTLQRRRYRFAVASAVWERWTTSGGALYDLCPAARDERDKIATVRSAIEHLSQKNAIEREMGTAEKAIRIKSSTKRIEGSAKNQIMGHAADAIEAATQWCDAVDALAARTKGASGADEEVVTELRAVAQRVKGAIFTDLEKGRRGDAGAAVILGDFYALLSGTPLAGTEMSPAVARAEGLLYGDQPVAPTSLAPVGDLDPEAVFAGLGRSLEEAFALRLERRDHVGATALVQVASAKGIDTEASLEPRRAAGLKEARDEVRTRSRVTSLLLDRARRQLYVNEDIYALLSGRLERASDPSRLDIDNELAEIESITAALARYKEGEIAAFASSIADLGAENGDFARRVEALLANGDLATATELAQQARLGLDLAEAEEQSFSISTFFPSVPAALKEGIDETTIGAVELREPIDHLDFTSLNDDAASRAGEAFAAWHALRNEPAAADMLVPLKPVLRLMGIEAGADDRRLISDIPSSPQRRWFDLTDVTLTGKALLPFFGSASGGRLRCLWVSGSPSAQTLYDWIGQDTSNRPIVILHPGTMAPDVRLAFGQLMRQRQAQPVIVVDDAVVAWLGSLGQSSVEPLMRATLPFSAGNPYLPPSGDCPIEMFYGRGAQVAEIQDAAGTCLVYGGRQLGKSALLRTAQRQFNGVKDHVAIYVDLKAPIETSHKPETVWTELVTKLVEAHIMPAPKSVPKDPMGLVTTAVNAWLDESETRRLLVLLDESDQFFDYDAQAGFVTTSRLKDLMDARGRRFKVVWAGLHQVRRFATVSNHPIAHLGAPLVVGALDPGPAFRLIERPCSALGLCFESDALVNRILAYCNYQPVLLHLFGQALLRRLCLNPGATLSKVPVIVTEEKVEEVAGLATLQAAIRDRLQYTLELDPRYKVITYAAAYEAHTGRPDLALSASELRASAERWWPAGFASVDASEFRSLLEELAGLGVLSSDPEGLGWRLRSVNVMRLLGTLEQVEDALLEEEEREPTVLESSEIREPLSATLRSPVTRAQLADLIGSGANQIRLVIGSDATGAEHLAAALDLAAAAFPPRFDLVKPKNKAQFRRALEDGGADRPRVVFSDLRDKSAEACADSLDAARTVTPWTGTRSVVLLVDARTMSWWMPYASLEPDPEMAGIEIVPLRRLDRLGIRAWASNHEAAFQDEDSRHRLLGITGGWPALVERADELMSADVSTDAVLAELAASLADDPGAAQVLVDIFGGAPGIVTDVYSMLAHEPTSTVVPEDLVLMLEGECEDPAAVVGSLRALGVVRATDEGEIGAEPVVARAWMAAISVGN